MKKNDKIGGDGEEETDDNDANGHDSEKLYCCTISNTDFPFKTLIFHLKKAKRMKKRRKKTVVQLVMKWRKTRLTMQYLMVSVIYNNNYNNKTCIVPITIFISAQNIKLYKPTKNKIESTLIKLRKRSLK